MNQRYEVIEDNLRIGTLFEMEDGIFIVVGFYFEPGRDWHQRNDLKRVKLFEVTEKKFISYFTATVLSFLSEIYYVPEENNIELL